VRVGWKRPTA